MTRFASTFLSHSWKQRALVEEVACELVRRGVVAWLDTNELPVGADLDIELRKANEAQLTLTAFISEESLASDWCREELEPRLARAGSRGDDAVLPVFLGDPFDLVSRSRALNPRWLNRDGTSVRRFGIPVEDLSGADPAEIARRLALAIFHRLNTREAQQIVLMLDHRGKGRRSGTPELPPNWAAQPWPALVFQPDMEERSENHVLAPVRWATVRDAIIESLAGAVGTRRPREVYVTGNAQLALPWLIGQQFDRSSGVKLVTHNPSRNQFLRIDFDDERSLLPLPKLPPTEVKWHEDAAPSATTGTVSLYVGPPNYVNAVHAHRTAAGDNTPLAVRETGIIKTTDDVIQLAEWMATAATQRPIMFYTALPFHVLPLLAALPKHQIGPVTVMEWDGRAYRACSVSP